MQLKVYVIEVKVPTWVKRLALYLIPAAVVLGLQSDLGATPTHFTAGTPLTAAALQSLNTAAYRTTVYSVGATAFCGAAPTTMGGNLGGYPGAKAMCERACGSPTAHMCTNDEVVRSLQLGYTLPYAYFTSGLVGGSSSLGVALIDDCLGWTNNNAGRSAPSTGGGQPTVSSCDRTDPVACCD